MMHYHDTFDIVRQRQAEAEQAAAVHRSSRDLREASSLRSGLARILIRAGELLAPTPAPPKLPRPKVHLVTGWYSRSYRTSPNSC
jgi:hypothetical protein